jgi:18S rRNA (adenine1779-N6/adenine1780-N6)-dimethyltransferase
MPKITSRQLKKEPTADDASQRHHGFTMNKDLGQHILKNPLVVQGIIDKVPSFSSFKYIY